MRVHLGADRLPALAQRLRIGVMHRRQDAEDGRVGPRQRLVAPRRERRGVGMVLLDPREIRPPVVATRRQQQTTRQPAPAVLRHRAARQPRQFAERTAAHQRRRFPHQRRAGGAGRRQLDAAAVGVGQGETHADGRGSEFDRGGCQHRAVGRPLHDLDAPGGDVGRRRRRDHLEAGSPGPPEPCAERRCHVVGRGAVAAQQQRCAPVQDTLDPARETADCDVSVRCHLGASRDRARRATSTPSTQSSPLAQLP